MIHRRRCFTEHAADKRSMGEGAERSMELRNRKHIAEDKAQEWTDRDVYDLALPYDEVLIDACQQIADAHNATLADERKRCDPHEFEKQAQVAVAYYEKQLTAEREKRELAEAASQKRYDDVIALGKETKQLREQLAAEREKMQPLMDALTDFIQWSLDEHKLPPHLLIDKARAALAKAKPRSTRVKEDS